MPYYVNLTDNLKIYFTIIINNYYSFLSFKLVFTYNYRNYYYHHICQITDHCNELTRLCIWVKIDFAWDLSIKP